MSYHIHVDLTLHRGSDVDAELGEDLVEVDPLERQEVRCVDAPAVLAARRHRRVGRRPRRARHDRVQSFQNVSWR